MLNLLLILAALFGALFLVINLTERFAKPMSAGQANKLSRIIFILVVVLVIVQAIRYL